MSGGRRLALATGGLVGLEAVVAVVVNFATSGDMRGWIWAVLVAVVVLTAGLAGWFASRGSGGARVRQKVSRGGTIDGSEIKAPADALVDVDQSATEGTIRDSGITLS